MKEEKEKEWRRKRGEIPSDEEEASEDASGSEEERGAGAARGGARKKKDATSSEEESSEEEDDDQPRRKGAEGLIEIENPNRAVNKTKKVSQVTHESAKPQLSRREREELEKQRAEARYRKLHEAGKTEEARADLARLAIIRKQREEAAKKREEEKKGETQLYCPKTKRFFFHRRFMMTRPTHSPL